MWIRKLKGSEMEFLYKNLTIDSSLFWRILQKTVVYSGLKTPYKEKSAKQENLSHSWREQKNEVENQTKTRVWLPFKNSISGSYQQYWSWGQILVSFPRRTSRVSVCWCTATSRLPRTGGSWCSEASSTGNTCPRKIRSVALPVSIVPCQFAIIILNDEGKKWGIKKKLIPYKFHASQLILYLIRVWPFPPCELKPAPL